MTTRIQVDDVKQKNPEFKDLKIGDWFYWADEPQTQAPKVKCEHDQYCFPSSGALYVHCDPKTPVIEISNVEIKVTI